MGISLAKGGRNINFKTLGKISIGWLATPVGSALICWVLLFFMQNVFMQEVYLMTTN